MAGVGPRLGNSAGSAGNCAPGLVSKPPLARHLVRASRLNRIYLWAEKNRAKGWNLRHTFAGPLRRWRNRTYQDGHPVQFGYGTLIREFYRWRKNGRTPQAIALRYRFRRIVTPDIVAEFVRRCLAPGVATFQAAYRALPRPIREKVKFCTLDKNLTPALRTRLLRLHYVRRLAVRTEQGTAKRIAALLPMNGATQ